MQRLSPTIGNDDATMLPVLSPNSVSTSDSPAVTAAKEAVDLLLRLAEIPDQVDPEYYIAMATAIFAEYPREVMMQAARIIPQRARRPYIDTVRKVLDELYAPILREEVRQRAHEEAQLCLPPPNPYVAPERRAELVAAARKAFGIPETGLPPKPVRPPPLPDDPGYRQRIAADLEARRVRNELLAQQAQPAETQSQPEEETQP